MGKLSPDLLSPGKMVLLKKTMKKSELTRALEKTWKRKSDHRYIAYS